MCKNSVGNQRLAQNMLCTVILFNGKCKVNLGITPAKEGY